MVQTAIDKWTLDYLSANLTDPEISVYVNKNNDSKFMYYEEEKNKVFRNFYEISVLNKIQGNYHFVPRTKQLKMSFKEFIDKVKETEESGSSDTYYLQQSLHQEGVNENFLNDFKNCNILFFSRNFTFHISKL